MIMAIISYCEQTKQLLKSHFTFFYSLWIVDYLEVTLKLSTKDLPSGSSQN